MKTLHNQQGFGMVGMLSALILFGLISYGLTVAGTEARKTAIYMKSKNFYEQLDVIKEALLAYQVDKITEGEVDPYIFAPNWAALTPSYLPECSTADNQAGKCRKAEQTLWGNTMTLVMIDVPTPTGIRGANQLTIPLPPKTEAFAFEHDVHLSTLLKLPFAKYDDVANTITWQVRKVGEELQHDGLVRRSGDNSTLTGDWDVGGDFAITNVKDVTIRNSDGSQRSIAIGIPSVIAKHNQRIDKHKCPTGLTPRITTTLKSFYNETNPRFAFNNIGSLRAYEVESSTYWTVKLDYWAEVQGVKTIFHDGEVKAEFSCTP